MILAELSLLSEAIKTHHDYYHILSGTDMPIVPMKQLNKFLSDNYGKEFLGVTPKWAELDAVKIRYSKFYFFQDIIGKNKSNPLYYVSRALAKMQESAPFINRVRNVDMKFYGGPVWFSITEEATRYLLSRQRKIEELFHHTYCCDEIFAQTILMNSDFSKKIYKYTEGNCYDSCRRYAKFEKESPKTLDADDYEEICNSGLLFARKFGTQTDKQRRLVYAVKEKCL